MGDDNGVKTKPDDPAFDEPASDEPASDEPASDEPASDEPVSAEPASVEPASDELASTGPAPEKPTLPKHDVLMVHSPTDDGKGLRALRARPGRLEMAEIRPMRRGQPLLAGEVVQLKKRAESPLLWDVDVKHSAEEVARWMSGRPAGPARVASRQFRDNWDEVFDASDARDDEPRPTVVKVPDLYRHNWDRIFLSDDSDDETDREQRQIDELCDPRTRTMN